MFAAFCLRNDSGHVARTFDAEEAASLVRCVEIAERWLEQFATNLEPDRAHHNHTSDDSLQGGPRPRNKLAFMQAQATRTEIENLLRHHDPLAPPLNERRIWQMLNRKISGRQIRRHLRAIRSRL